MQIAPATVSKADQWIATIFSAKAAQTGGFVRRHRDWVAKEIGRDRFEAEVRRRGFHLIETGSQLVIICNNSAIKLVF